MQLRAAFVLMVVLTVVTLTAAAGLATGLNTTRLGMSAGAAWENEAIVRRFYAAVEVAIRTGDAAGLDALLAPGFADHPAPADGAPARDALLAAVRALHAASPDLRVEVETVAAGGDTVVVRSRLRRDGAADIPAATGHATTGGERVDVFRVAGGEVTEHWGIGEAGARCGAPADQSVALPAALRASLGAILARDGLAWAGPGERPNPRWQVEGAAVAASPVVADGTVYAALWGGVLLALDAATGAERWRFTAADQILAPPVAGDGTVYAVTASGTIQAVDAATGRDRWHAHAAGLVGRGLTLADETLYLATGSAPPPAVVDGIVYAARGKQRTFVQAFDAATGAERWRRDLAEPALYAIEAATLHERWRLELDGETVSALLPTGGAVYVAADGLSRVDAATGQLRWRADLTSGLGLAPVIGDGLVYLAEPDGRLRALEAGTGSERWAVATGGGVVSSPVVAGGVVYLGSRDGHLSAIDAATGAGCGRWALGGVASSPAVAGGVAYVGTLDGRLSALAVAGSPLPNVGRGG